MARAKKRRVSNATIGFMIGLPAAVLCIMLIAMSVSSGNDQYDIYDQPMREPVYDRPAYTANAKAPTDVDFTKPEIEFATAGETTVITPEEAKPTGGVTGTQPLSDFNHSVVVETEDKRLPSDQRIQAQITPAEQAAGEQFESSGGSQGTATHIVDREGNDISDQIWKDDNVTTYNSFTELDSVADAGGKLGSISIPSINLSVEVYQSETSEIEAMQRGVAHFNSTSSWDGNVGLCGHNWTSTGKGDYFKNLNKVKKGDTISYTTKLGTRNYKVSNIVTIDQSDWSYLNRTDDNRLTIITCTFNDNSKRLCVQAVAV